MVSDSLIVLLQWWMERRLQHEGTESSVVICSYHLEPQRDRGNSVGCVLISRDSLDHRLGCVII